MNRVAVFHLLVFAGACAARASAPAAVDHPIDLEGARPGEPTGSLAGAVRDVASGEPVAFAAIEVVDRRGRRAVDTTGEAGQFTLTLPAGRYRLTASFGGLRAELPDVVVLRGRTTRLHLDLDSRRPLAGPRGEAAGDAIATGEIAGRVTDGVGAGAEPFAGVVIAAMAPGLGDAPMAISDRRGSYRLRGLRPGRYDLTIYYQLVDRGAIELRRADVEVRAGRITHVDLELDLRK